MVKVNQVQILDVAVYISHSGNILRKGMSLTILPPAIGKIVGQTRLSNLDMPTGLGEEKL